jgi:pyruvate dehydrogenase E1 component
MTVPNLKAYDPAYAYELAVIIRSGLQRMYAEGEDIFYYITVMNENYPGDTLRDDRAKTPRKGEWNL